MPVLTKVVRHDPKNPADPSPKVLGWAAFPEAPENPAVFSMSVDGETDLWMSLGQRWSVPLVDEPPADGKLPGANLEVHVVTLAEFDQLQKTAQARARFTPQAGHQLMPHRVNGG